MDPDVLVALPLVGKEAAVGLAGKTWRRPLPRLVV